MNAFYVGNEISIIYYNCYRTENTLGEIILAKVLSLVWLRHYSPLIHLGIHSLMYYLKLKKKTILFWLLYQFYHFAEIPQNVCIH